ncbi:MAG: protein rarD [Microbacterium sp.]|nr:protein rarD [Microbacterium sp.]
MTPETTRATQTAGVAYAGAAYLLWGVLPLYFLLLVPTGPWEVVAWRVLLSFVFCLLLLTVTRGWAPFGVILRQPKLLGWTALAGLLIYINWQVFLIGTLSGNVVETSLGYFINPITTVLLGVFVLKESIRKLQWAAIAIAAIAVVVIVVAYGDFPWIALSLTASFGVYGLIKKKIGPAVDAVSGLTLESFWLIPIAVVQLIVVASTPAGITMGGHGWVPVMQFVIGVAVLHEPMPPERWAGFVIVWIAIGVFVVDLLIAGRRGRRIARTDLV